MNAIEVLPDIWIEVRGAVSQQFLLQGVNTLLSRQSCALLQLCQFYP